MTSTLKIIGGYTLGLLYVAGGIAYATFTLPLDAFDWTVTLCFLLLGVFFMGATLLATPEADDIDVAELEGKFASHSTDTERSMESDISPNAEKEIAAILLNTKLSILEAYNKTQTKSEAIQTT